MKRILIFLLPIFLTVACSFSAPSPAAPLSPTEAVSVPPTSITTETASASITEPANLNDYVIFSINVQDFSYPEQSAAILDRIITLHETYNVPVDIYLTDIMAQIYAEQFPQLLERLKTSPVVAISYHYRPPRPYAISYDWLGLRNMSAEERYQTILRYETHAIDPVSGQTTDAPGGYQYLAALIGYPPYAAPSTSNDADIESATLSVFKELGAQMTLGRGSALNLGDTKQGLYVRPEHYDYKLFEQAGADPAASFEQALQQAHQAPGAVAPYFLGVKMHDNDFFAEKSAWVTVYVDGGKRPNWDPTRKSPLLSQAEQDAVWAQYEQTVAYVASQQERIGAVNLPMVLDMLAAAPEAGAVPTAASPLTGDSFTPAPVPELTSGSGGQQPLYFFLFTHTEDPFNHNLSEERYTRLVPEVQARAASHPEAHLVWTIQFQGSDAQTIVERNPQTGVLDLLRAAAQAGVVEFGYHAHHDPTYNNRPQNSFTETTPWEDLVTGMVDWLGCAKDVNYGGCIQPTGGGVSVVQEYFGPVQVLSGSYLQSDTAYEGGPASHAAQSLLPGRILGFGFPDHGPFAQAEIRTAAGALMTRLTPTNETSATLFWADNVLKISDGSPLDNASSIDALKGPKAAAQTLTQYDTSRPNIVLTGFASKYLYTRNGTSPTIYGYAHPEAPQLPPEWLNTPKEREQNYQKTMQTLDYLLEEVLPANPGSRFVTSQDVINMVAPPDYWTVSPAQLDVLARWALLNWTNRPPDWVSDGTDFYSLRDLFALLTQAFGAGANQGSGPDLRLPLAYGPLQAVDATGAVTLSRDEIVTLARQLAPNFAPDQPWQVTPNAMVQPTYATSAGTVTAAQLLYGMATVYAADFAGTPVNAVTLPATQAMPVTYDLLRQIGCINTCSGTAWSFKPARIRVP